MIIVYLIGALAVGVIAGVLSMRATARAKDGKAKEEIERLSREAKAKAEEIARKADLDAKEMLYKLRVDFDKQNAGKMSCCRSKNP